MLLATLLAVGLMPISAQAQEQGNQRPTPRQTIQNTDPEDTYEGTPDSRRGTATQERQGTPQNRVPGTTTQRGTQLREGQVQPGQQGQQGMEEQLSLMVAAKMAIMNDCEIKTSQMAHDKIDNEEVKQFAQMMIRDHQQLNQKLMQAMPELRGMVNLQSSDRTSATAQPGEARLAQTPDTAREGVRIGTDEAQTPRTGDQNSDLSPNATQRATGYRGTAGEQGSMTAMQQKMLDICEKTAQNSLEMTRQEFSEKQGKELAMCYIGSQVVVHQQTLAHLKALQGEGTQEFQQIVQQAEESVQQHLTEAKSIVEKLGSESGESDSRSSTQPAQPRPQGQPGQNN